MPILFPEFEEDFQAILDIAETVVEFWNDYGAEYYGFTVFTSQRSVERVSQQGDIVLGSYFYDEPGPFKRLAALLVLAKLEPLFHLGTYDSAGWDEFKPTRYQMERDWLPRICYLMVPLIFEHLRIRREGLPDLPLTEWKGFPSGHSKAEFFQWMEWIRLYNSEQLLREENLVILGRRVLSASLILEAVYFQGEVTSKICGICDKGLDLTSVAYEGQLWENLRNAKPES